jgi:rifampicin phosphotransferase
VEWVWDGKSFWIVQARPITVRGRYTYPGLANQPTLWSRGNSRDVVPDPLSPLDWSVSLLDRMLIQSYLLSGYETLPGVRRTALHYGRLYFETSIIQWEFFDGFDVPPRSCNKMMGGHQPEISVPKATVSQRLARVRRSLRYIHRIGADWSRKLPEDNPFRRTFAEFIQRYGHRGVYETYLRNPRWREAPDYLLNSVVNLIGCDPEELRERQKRISDPARRRMTEALPFWYRPLIPILVKFATVERNLREAGRSALMAYWEVVRCGTLALGVRSTGLSGLEQPEDIFNLTLPEVLALAEGDLPVACAAKRAAWRRRQLKDAALQVEPEVIIEHGVTIPPTAPVETGVAKAQDTVWRGAVVSCGQARGIACIARHPTEALNMLTGAILVTPSTDPSWTPLFLRAGALVMETGGFLSHGAIVAREFGIPAVVNLPGILSQIKNGDTLEVDGNRGTVRRL